MKAGFSPNLLFNLTVGSYCSPWSLETPENLRYHDHVQSGAFTNRMALFSGQPLCGSWHGRNSAAYRSHYGML